jgi:hypothetical protein
MLDVIRMLMSRGTENRFLHELALVESVCVVRHETISACGRTLAPIVRFAPILQCEYNQQHRLSCIPGRNCTSPLSFRWSVTFEVGSVQPNCTHKAFTNDPFSPLRKP